MSSASIEKQVSDIDVSREPALECHVKSLDVDPQKVFWKLDIRLVPLACLLYLLSFLDRTSIGNAKIAGLVGDLHLTGLRYNLCAAILLIPYALFEVPSNLALKRVGPSRWIPFIMFCWGVIVVTEGFVKSFGGLMTARVFQGIAESGIFPGLTFYLCVWYPRTAHAQRISLLYSAVTLAGAFGGLLAFAIVKMDGIGGLHGWSWIFILEGLVTIVVATFAWFFMSDYPDMTTFLTEPERAWLVETLKNDTLGLSRQFKRKFVFQALRDPHIWLLFGIHFCLIIPGYAFSLFLPTIITGLGFSATTAQLLSVPPNAAGCITTVVAGVLSDRVHARGPFILVGSLVALAGYATLFATTDPWAGYAGTILAACGLFPSIACVLAWAGGNSGGEVKRAVAIAIVIGCGNLGPIVSSFIYRQQDSPRYLPGHGTAVGCLCVAAVLCTIAMLEFARLNRKKIAQCEREGITMDMTGEFVEMGDASPLYSVAGFPELRVQDVGVELSASSDRIPDAYTCDYIIIGGGTSGSVLASLLSEDPNVSILVLEKGPLADSWASRIPLLGASLRRNDYLGVAWRSVPQRHADDRPIPIIRGEVLGGASRINGALYTRGTPGDYNRWEELGNAGWGYKDLEPYFVKSEGTQAHQQSEFRGKEGFWKNKKGTNPFRTALHIDQALQRAGIEHVQDFNDPKAPAACTGPLDVIVDPTSRRQSTDWSFLPPEVAGGRRERLKVCTRARVKRVQLDTSQGDVRATGVVFESMDPNQGGQELFAKARREVIVCAGALVSPQILMLSGLGPKEHLHEIGIDVVQDMPAKDHIGVPVKFTVPIEDSFHHLYSSPLKTVVEFAKHLFLGTGLFSSTFQHSSTFIPTRLLRDDLMIASDDPRNLDTSLTDNRPDIEFMHIPVDCVRVQTPAGKGTFTFLVTLIRPKSEGTVRLVSGDACAAPAVDLGSFTDAQDYVPLRAGVRLALRVAEDVGEQGYQFADLLVPEIDSDEGIDSFIRKNAISCFHYTSTCRMGLGAHGARPSVVDTELKVHGVKGLRVCDASVFPEIIGSHTMAPAVMVAEKCADMIKGLGTGLRVKYKERSLGSSLRP